MKARTKKRLVVGLPVLMALLTDLHGVFYGSGQQELKKAIDDQTPDLILLAGDIVDDVKPTDGAEQLADALTAFPACAIRRSW